MNCNDHQSAFALYQRGQLRDALDQIEPQRQQSPDDVNLLVLAGACYSGLNRHFDAVACWERAAELAPGHAETHGNLGISLYALGRFSEAADTLRRALAIDPAAAHAGNNLGLALWKLGRFSEAEQALHQTLFHQPNAPEARNSLGSMFFELGRLPEAERSFRLALDSRPDFADARHNLGLVLTKSRRLHEAEAQFRRALTLRPLFAGASNNLGIVLLELGRTPEAEVEFRRAIEAEPDLAVAHVNLARALHGMQRLDEAEAAARSAARLNGKLADAQLVLGSVLTAKNAGDLGPALAAYRRAIELDPASLPAHSNFVYSLLFQSDDGYEILEACKRCAAQLETPYLSRETRYPNDRVADRRLRVGYVSPDFRGHVQSFFMMPLLRHHDAQAVEIFCYSSVANEDETSEQLRQFAHTWRSVSHLDDDALAEQIARDRIDILVDLTMHMSNGRPLLFARRPAPVQVAWLAYPGTTGSSAIGYRLTDPWLDPSSDPRADARYSERSIRLPDTFWCYDPLVNNIAVATLPADRNGRITFGCLNNPQKFTDRAFRLWANVLGRVRGSSMILRVAEGAARDEVSRKFAELGVAASRLTFVGYQTRHDYLKTYDRVDIALDTFPYNGHTTSLDGFWMGVPVITRVGSTPASRAGFSMLANLELPELVALSDEQFVELAVGLAGNRARLRQLRSEIRRRMAASVLMDGPRFARAVESAYRSMWKDWCEAPEALPLDVHHPR
ncbi:TPR repeat-containing protein [Caballeronia peredens]|nr:TPR repeat-containing protein [Caballeronia peredens]